MNTSLDQPSVWHVAFGSSAVFVVALMFYVATATPSITMRHGGTDGGELAVMALGGGVAHPPSYSTYPVLARLALHVPRGEPAARLAVVSAACGAAAAAATAALAMEWCARSAPTARWWTHALPGAGGIVPSAARHIFPNFCMARA